MNIITEVQNTIPPSQLAKSLANASPDEFADFWFAFNEECNDENLDLFAQAMSPQFGGNRKKPFKKLCKLLEYYETKAEMDSKD